MTWHRALTAELRMLRDLLGGGDEGSFLGGGGKVAVGVDCLACLTIPVVAPREH